ncbi:MAG: hypothetical protein GWN61_14365, partial [candidate division Zixibacteria bacterium]|nr:hypothetical protein [candidate division KSB1 bacterium]NIV07321.1 hypothetical protein [candidate division Zixibacteria bacterium]NIS23073.1 hypothetical protein [candidate division KSB1 bacterium]NIU23574.1 hypothetical protein [candidate division KSB1 bacterium]NIV93571.1 hypothetical protein [candidate division KSB1 bacterium]
MSRFVLVSLILLLGSQASAQIFSESARTEFLGALGIRAFYGRINKTDFVNNDKPPVTKKDQNIFINVLPVAVVYGLNPKLSIIGIVPTIRRSLERTGSGTKQNITNYGIGDVTLFGKYRFYKKDAFLKSRQLALQLGVKMPTGADDLEDQQGNRLPPPLQLGSGSVDYR